MIKENRIKNNLTQEALAELVDMSPRQIQRIEANPSKTRISTLRKIIKVLNISDSDIIKFMREN